ncbi:hypothetical protein T484DRAFT_1777953 [Baffinella frigidus]|nr:hypothetical protein T484DRAFT_1777953 [Cryptophyta sp. CCMP2293]
MWLQLATAKVDVAVVEVGVGGRLDATNVCSSSLVSVVGAIALDHTALVSVADRTVILKF